MKIYFVTSECAPFAKSGGLADVAYALPKKFAEFGHDVRVVLPLYSKISHEIRREFKYLKNFEVFMPHSDKYAGVFSYEKDGVTYYFLDNEEFFSRDELYGYADDGERFSYFSRAVLELMERMDFYPDIIHLNDWHCGPSATIFKDAFAWKDQFKKTKVIFTIHNLKYQGKFPYEVLRDNLGLSDSYYVYDKLEHFGSVNFMKAGINYADYITTVSKTYAKELQYDYFAEGLHSILQQRSHLIRGIVNGIDYEYYNPETDKDIFANYSSNDIKNKYENKIKLQRELSLNENLDAPIISMVSRLVSNKGFDLVSFIFDELMEENIQFVLLGSGEREIEDRFLGFARKYKGRVSVQSYFSEAMAKKIYAASDIFLMPSRFEPCGLGQLIAMRYGTVPVIRKTGGLADTVEPYNKFTGEGEGFAFQNYNAHELLFSTKAALGIYSEKEKWNRVVKQAMQRDHSWNNSAREYEKLYLEVMGGNVE